MNRNMKPSPVGSTRLTAVLMTALLAAPTTPKASAESFLEKLSRVVIHEGADRVFKDPKMRRLAKEVTAFFPNAQVRQGENGEAILAAMLGALAVDLVIRAATSVERAEARRRGEAAEDRYRKLPAPESNAPVSSTERTQTTPEKPVAPKYVAIELPATADVSPASSAEPAPPTRFMVYDIETHEVIGDRVYEAATRPKDEEKIRIGDSEVTFIQATDAVAARP
jgi:hypothetical protein